MLESDFSPMPATILDGNKVAAEIRSEAAAEVKAMAAAGLRPGLAVVLVGNNPASEIYVRGKVKSCEELGIYGEQHTPSANVTTEELLELVADLNRRDKIAGQETVVVGRSDIVGKPMAMLLLNANATVTVCHSKTRDLPAVCRRADILVAAIGRAGMITREFVRPGATVIDVGMNRVTDPAEFAWLFAGNAKREQTFRSKGSVLVGDVHPEVAEVAGAITPVPGGVGPLTIAMLMANTVKAAKMRRGDRRSEF